jgi:uncharacterized membrane protein
MPSNSLTSPPILCAIAAGLCWGVGEIFTKSAINSREIGPLGAVLIRAAVTLPLAIIGFIVASKLMRTETEPFWTQMTAATWLKVLLGSGVLAGFAGVFFFYFGLSLKGGEISVLRPIAFALAPATAVLLGWWFLGEGMTVKKGLAVVLIISGILMLAGEGKKTTSTSSARARVAADNVPQLD